jgi:hypothetical protein
MGSGMKVDWKWVGVGYCLFVVFHLLPTYLLLEFSFVGRIGDALRTLWLIVGLLVIGVYIGYRSRGFTILEPAISAVLYVITIFFKADEFVGRRLSVRTLGALMVAAGIAFFLAMLGAWIGELLQASGQRKAAQQ